MSTFEQLWNKLRRSKKYREEFVAAQVKRGIPFQIRAMLKKSGLPQEEIAARAGLTQGVISRAANPDYGNLTLNTLIRIAAGFDVAFVGKFVPFSELAEWFTNLSESNVLVTNFETEDKERNQAPAAIDVLHVPIGQLRQDMIDRPRRNTGDARWPSFGPAKAQTYLGMKDANTNIPELAEHDPTAPLFGTQRIGQSLTARLS